MGWLQDVLLADGSVSHSLCCAAYSIHIHKNYCPMIFVMGTGIWTLVEYVIHRFIFHMKPANNYYLITLHFLLHGQHHKVSGAVTTGSSQLAEIPCSLSTAG